MSASADPLRVTVLRTGGVAGLRRAWLVSAAELAAQEAGELRRLVAAAGIRDEGEVALPHAGLPDAFSYAVRACGPLPPPAPTAEPAEALAELVEFVLRAGRPEPYS